MTRTTFDRIAKSTLRQSFWLHANYLEDLPDPRSRREAFRLVRKAVKMGLRDARAGLAYYYDTGACVRPSRRMGRHWYRKAWRSGSSLAARNQAITLRTEGCTSSAITWFHRAIASGDPDSRLDLVKLLLVDPSQHNEAHRLLEEYVAIGPQQTYEVRPGRPHPLIPMVGKNLGDESYAEAKQVLKELEGAAHA